MTSAPRHLPTISCIVPTFNRSAVICQTVEMLLNQTVRPIEIILIDQSTRTTPECQEQLQRWKAAGDIVWLKQQEPNASMARNRGALAATGDVLLILDDDIRIAPDFVEAHAKNYLDDAVAAVAGQILEGAGEIVYERTKCSDDPELDWIYFQKNFGRRVTTTWMASGNVSVRRAVYFEVGGMDENYFKGASREESDFAIRFMRRGYRFQFDPTASVYHLAVAGAPEGGTRHKSWINYWFAMYGFWYFLLGCTTRKTWRVHLTNGVRYFLVNSMTLRRPWRIPVLAAQFVGTFVMALVRRLRGPKTLVGRCANDPSVHPAGSRELAPTPNPK